VSQKVVVAMSGGVDSSVAAALLQDQGYEVIGMMMRLWSEDGRSSQNRCCTPEAMGIAREVAGMLDIPFYAIDAKQAFRDTVVEYFLDGHTNGETPNPCLACNREIRWEFLLNQALNIGADFMATGHYVRLVHDEGQNIQLFEAKDQNKDQSYVLSVLNQDKLKHALFPLGDLLKSEVYEIAKQKKLPAAQSKESQDLCFLGGDDYRDFLSRNAPTLAVPGPIMSSDGEILGEHAGLVHYTIGQRKGIGVSAPKPLYVLNKRQSDNTLIIGDLEELGKRFLDTGRVNWLSGQAPDRAFDGSVKIRYSANKAPARIIPQKNASIHVEFESPMRDITPGQAAVVYKGEKVLGSGLIQNENMNQHVEDISEALMAP
jgi:tRNA-specific 2-thiouridylase